MHICKLSVLVMCVRGEESCESFQEKQSVEFTKERHGDVWKSQEEEEAATLNRKLGLALLKVQIMVKTKPEKD